MAFEYSRFLTALIERGAMTEKQFFEQEIAKWKESPARKAQITGDRYYRGRHDILERKRTGIGRDGMLQTLHNLPNNQIVDNQYAKMVDQKTNYLLGKAFNLETEDEKYKAALSEIFDKRFKLTFQNLYEAALIGGIAWLYIYYDVNGLLKFRRFETWEILPFWKDAEHTELDCVVRVYETEAYEGSSLRKIEKVEIYTDSGVKRYTLSSGVLVEDTEDAYILLDEGKPYNWGRIPIIPFKYNDEELPLICKVKSLQDAINITLSDFENNMQEDPRNTILILKNYDGENLAEFRANLAAYGAVKVKTMTVVRAE